MGIQAWMVKSWPTVEWYLPDRVKTWPLFQHVVTNVRDEILPQGRRCGDTVWVGVVSGHNVGVSWDWVELRRGVVMLTDPNSIVCNVCFVSAAPRHQAPLLATVSLNRFVRHLPWQGPVCAALRAASDPSAEPRLAAGGRVRRGPQPERSVRALALHAAA